MSDLNKKKLGKYQIQSKIGSGGMADVYKAYHPHLERTVAIKVMKSHIADREGFVEFFQREAKAVARLRHPNIVQVFDFDVADGLHYMVMEYVEGPTLSAELKRRMQHTQPYTLREIVGIFDGLAAAVGYAHTRGVIHRDLKPDNTMFSPEGQVMLTDFGIAHLMTASDPVRPTFFGGTPAYMSPEQAENKPLDLRSDIYALGIMLYEMLTGRRPFTGNSRGEIIRQQITTPLPPLKDYNPNIPPAVEDVICKATSKTPDERFVTAQRMAQELREAVGLTDSTLLPSPFLPGEDTIGATTGKKSLSQQPATRQGVTRDIETAAFPLFTNPLSMPSCPYRGLFAFREQDAPFFFGRETVVDHLIDMVEQQSSVAIIGPSGSGKSSVVLAGLLPSLHQASQLRYAQGTAWIISHMRPGRNPFHSLAAAWADVLSNDKNPQAANAGHAQGNGKSANPLASNGKPAADDVAGDYTSAVELLPGSKDSPTIAEMVAQILEQHPRARRLLLVIDQFEELYTLCNDMALRRKFLDELLAALPLPPDSSPDSLPNTTPFTTGKEQTQPRVNPSPLTIVFTLRADFVGHALSYRPVADLIQASSLILGPMNRQELFHAVVSPAKKQGIPFDKGLVERILNDVGNEPGNLPLLEFALTLLWEQNEEGLLTHRAYEAIGRVEGALASYAEEVYTNLTTQEQEQARRIFVQLVQPGEGTEDTRRLAYRRELHTDDWQLVCKLADKRLVVTGRDADGDETVEIVHEALIRGWNRLRDWMNADRAFRAWQERLRADIQQWENSGQDEGGLLRGVLLAEAEAWREDREKQIGQEEHAYIQAGIAVREREQYARESLRRRIMVWSVGAALLVLFLMLMTGWQWRLSEQRGNNAREAQQTAEAERDRADQNADQVQQQARIDTARKLAAEAQVLHTMYPQRSLLLAIEAISTTSTSKGLRVAAAEEVLRQTLATIGGTPLNGHRATVTAVAISSDDRWIVTASRDATVRVWDRQQLAKAPVVLEHAAAVTAMTLSQNGRWLATLSEDNTLRLWHMQDLASDPHILPANGGSFNEIALSPDGRWLAGIGSEAIVSLWDTRNLDDPPLFLSGHTARLHTLAWSQDSRWLASGSADTTIRLWDVTASITSSLELDTHTGAVTAMMFSADGQWLVSGSSDQTARLWTMTNPLSPSILLDGHEQAINEITMSQDGQWIATADTGSIVRLWNRDTPATPIALRGHEGAITALRFDPTGNWLATASRDHTVMLWNIQNPRANPRVLRGHDDTVTAIQFSADGTQLVSGSADHTARLWNLAQPATDPLILHGDQEPIMQSRFSPDSRWLATASGSTVRLWDMQQLSAEPTILRGYEKTITRLAFSPDSRWLAVAGWSNRVMIWDMTRLQNPPLVLQKHDTNSTITAVTFSPLGKWLATVATDETVWVWNMTSPEQNPVPLPTVADSSLVPAFSPDEQWLALDGSSVTDQNDTSIHLWAMSNLQQIPPLWLSGHEGRVFALEWSHDGQWLASAGEDATVRLWARSTPTTRSLILRGHEDHVTSLAWSQHDRWLATASNDTTIRLWKRTTLPTSSLVLRGHMADVTDLTFSPDSHLLTAVSSNEVALWDIDNPADKPVLLPGNAVSFSPDGTWLATVQDDSVALRRVSLPHLVTLACETVGRNLSWEEWIQFMETQPYRPTCAQQPVHPSVAEALLQQGRELAQQEKVKQATSVFSRVLTLDPTAQIEPVALAHTLLAKTLWQKGQDLAREEDIAAASDMFRQALVHDPSLRINPEQEAERLAVETLQTRAEDLARQGNIEEATRFFTRAKSYSPSLKLDPQARAHHLYAVALYEYGREQAQEGNVTEAITKFQQAKTYSPTMNLDPQQEAWQLAAEKYLADGKEFAQQGNIQEALAYFTDVHTYAPAKISASAWNNLCWWGSLWNQSSDDILAACNHAVRLAPQNGNIRESRGVARALQGDYAGAIEDLTYAREHGSGNQARLDAWIAALEAGQNPFDTPTLRELRELN